MKTKINMKAMLALSELDNKIVRIFIGPKGITISSAEIAVIIGPGDGVLHVDECGSQELFMAVNELLADDE